MKKSVGIGMYKISNSSQEILEKMLGKRYKDIVNMDCDEEISYIQKRNNRKLIFSGKVDKRKIGRGNPLLSRRRIKTMDKVNEGLARIK